MSYEMDQYERPQPEIDWKARAEKAEAERDTVLRREVATIGRYDRRLDAVEAERDAANADLARTVEQLHRMQNRLEAAEAEVRKLREALEWYAEQAEWCRKIGSSGDPARHALDNDGGKRARAALSPTPDSGENTPRLCDCERGQSGFGLAARVCDCPRPAPDSGENTGGPDDKA